MGWTAVGGSPIVVANGETLDSLSGRYGVPAAALLSANGLSSPSEVRGGMRLVVPVYHADDHAVASAEKDKRKHDRDVAEAGPEKSLKARTKDKEKEEKEKTAKAEKSAKEAEKSASKSGAVAEAKPAKPSETKKVAIDKTPTGNLESGAAQQRRR